MTMHVSTPVRPSCRDLIAQLSAFGLVTASAGFGAVYAWGSGSAHGATLGCLAVLAAIALDAAKPFAVSGAIEAARSWDVPRSFGLAMLAAVAVLFSLTVELQLMARTRADLVAERAGHSQTVADARQARDEARRDLDTIGATRSAAELAPLLKSARQLAGDCARITTATQRDACKTVPQLEAEAARAPRHEAALAALAAATAAISTSGHAKSADPGATALASYLAALGVNATADRLGDWLTLVGVLALEVGSALAGLLCSPVHRRVAVHVTEARQTGAPAPAQPPVQSSTDSARQRVLDIITAAGGSVQGGQRAFAVKAGVSPTRLRQVLDGLTADGLVKVRAGTTGTAVQLVTA